MMRSFLSRTPSPVAFTAGALTVLGLSSGCTGETPLPGGSGGSGGSSAELAPCVPTKGGMVAPVVPWSRGFAVEISGATTDRDAAVIVGAGSIYPPTDLGLGPLGGAETGGDVVAKFSPDGQILWNRSWDGPSAPVVATDGCGNVFVARNPSADPTMDPRYSARSLVIAKLDGQGHDLWQHSFHLEPKIQVSRILINADGDAIMLGGFQGLVELGKDVLSSPKAITPFLAAFRGTTGETLWNVDVKADGPIGIGLSPEGEVIVAGNFTRVGKLGVPVGSVPAGSLAVARLSATGTVQSFAGTGASLPFIAVRFAVSPQGDVGAVGLCPVVGSHTGQEWCMTRYPASGAAAAQYVITSQPISADGGQVAFDAQGNLLMLADSFVPPVPNQNQYEHLYFTRMTPAGTISRAEDWPTTGIVTARSLEVDPAGGIVFTAFVTGSGVPTIDLGNGPVSTGIVARIAP